jgi:FKBP-type peptidyl-prolyl cis-trans isomerase
MQMDGDKVGDEVEPTVESATDISKPFLDRTAPARQAIAQENREAQRLFQHRKQKIELAIQQLSHQDSMLQRAIENAESLPELHASDAEDEDHAAAEAKKSKKKKTQRKKTAAEKAAEERPCGFDMRLIEEIALGVENGVKDQDNVTMHNGDEPVDHSSICLLPRKKCDRHSGYVSSDHCE